MTPELLEKDRKRRFLRAVGLSLRIVSGTFSILMAYYIMQKLGQGMSFFQGLPLITAFFLGGPTLYCVGLVIHRKYKKALIDQRPV